MIDLAAIRAKHVPDLPSRRSVPWCDGCGDDTWPCDAAALLAELARVEASKDVLAEQAESIAREATDLLRQRDERDATLAVGGADPDGVGARKSYTWEHAVRTLAAVVPGTYGEAIQAWPWLGCQPHEWHNRTTPENAAWLIRQLQASLAAATQERDAYALNLEHAQADNAANAEAHREAEARLAAATEAAERMRGALETVLSLLRVIKLDPDSPDHVLSVVNEGIRPVIDAALAAPAEAPAREPGG